MIYANVVRDKVWDSLRIHGFEYGKTRQDPVVYVISQGRQSVRITRSPLHKWVFMTVTLDKRRAERVGYSHREKKLHVHSFPGSPRLIGKLSAVRCGCRGDYDVIRVKISVEADWELVNKAVWQFEEAIVQDMPAF